MLYAAQNNKNIATKYIWIGCFNEFVYKNKIIIKFLTGLFTHVRIEMIVLNIC